MDVRIIQSPSKSTLEILQRRKGAKEELTREVGAVGSGQTR